MLPICFYKCKKGRKRKQIEAAHVLVIELTADNALVINAFNLLMYSCDLGDSRSNAQTSGTLITPKR